MRRDFGEVEMGGEFAVDIAGDDGVDDDVAGGEVLAEAGEMVVKAAFVLHR